MSATTVAQSTRIWTADFVKVCFANGGNFGSFYLLLAALPIYIVSVGGTEAEVGLIMGVFAISALLARPVLGIIVDQIGRKTVLVLSLLGMAAVSLGYILATSVFLLLTMRLLHGIAFAGTTTAAGTYMADIVPPSRRAEATGYYGVLQNVALALGPGVGVAAVDAASFVGLFLLSACVGLVGMGAAAGLRGLARPVHDPTRGRVFGRLISRPALRPAFVQFWFAVTYAAQVSFLPVYVTSRDLGNPGWYFFVYAVVLIVFRPLAGRISDRFGRGTVVLPGTALAAVSMLVLSLATNVVWLVVVAVLFAAAFGLTTPSIHALVIDLTKPSERGSAVATFTSAMDLGIGAGSVLWGLVAQLYGLTMLFQLAALAPVIAALLFFTTVRDRVPAPRLA